VITLVASVATLTVLAILLIALVEHAARPGSLPRALAGQRVVPAALCVPVAAAAVAAEGALAALGAAGLARGPDGTGLVRVALAASACLFGVYAAYSRYLVAARDGAPCGCAGSDAPVNRWVVGRAALLAATALAAVPLAARVTALTADPGRFATAVAAGATFAVLLWHLPTAMEDPARTVQLRGRRQLLQHLRGGGAHEL
jgi:hypothetical protein